MKSILVLCVVWKLTQCTIDQNFLQKLVCKKSNPEYEKCLLGTIKRYMPFIMKGMPALGLPSLDPLNIPELSLNQSVTGVANVTAIFTNLELIGFRNTVFNSLKVDPINLYGKIKITIPWIHAETDYDINGKFMGAFIRNKGHFEGNFTNVKIKMKASLTTYKHQEEDADDGLDYFKVNTLSQHIKIKSGHIKLLSKDKNFQRTVDMVADFFNNNPSTVLDSFGPILTGSAVSTTRNKLDTILGNFPVSVLLPEE